MRKLFKYTLSILTILIYSTTLVSAQNNDKQFQEGLSNRGLILTPVTIYLSGKRGETISNESTKFKLTNDFQTVAATKVYPQTVNMKTNLNGEAILDYETRSSDNDFANWFNIDLDEYDLQHKEVKEFKFSIKVPENAAGGSHMAMIVLPRTKEDLRSNTNAAFAKDQLGLNIFLTINDDIKFSSDASRMFTSDISNKEKGFFWGGTTRINTEIFNSGNIYVRPQGNLFVHKGDKTKPIETFKFNEDATLVGRDAKRLYSFDFSNGGFINQEIADGKIKNKLNWGKFFDIKFGRYYVTYQGRIKPSEQANPALLNGQDVIVVEKTISFYIFPIQLVILLAVALVIGFILYFSLRSKDSVSKNNKRL